MTLTVGTLVGYVSLDLSELERAEASARRSVADLAQEITRVLERASTQAGQSLGEGVRDGAERAASGAAASLGGVAQAAARAGDDASQALASGMAAGGQEGGQAAAREAEQGLARVAQAADAAASEAGQELQSGLAEGAAEGAQGAVNAASARFDEIADAARRAAGQAGDAMEGPLADGGREAGEEAGDQVAAGLEAKDAAIAAVAVAVGAAFVAGFGSALESGNATGLLQAQLGTTDAVAAQHGKTAGKLYGSGLVENIDEAADVIRGIAQQGLLPPEATQGQIEAMGKKVSTAAAVMGEDVSNVSRAVGTMLKSGIATSADEAIDVLVAGTQRGANAAEDLLDTFAEYPTQFRDLGLSAEEAMGLLQQGLQGGARDADTVADGLKEFAIRAKDMSETSVQGFDAIGLSAREMAAIFAKGGPQARDALQMVIGKINEMEDPVARNTAGVNLFGTKFEDMQQAFYSLNPDTAVAALGKIGGATDEATKALSETAGARIEQFKRAFEQGVTNFIGEKVIPPLLKLGEIAKAMWDALPEGAQNSIKMLGDLALVVGAGALVFGLGSKAVGLFRTGLGALSAQAAATSGSMRVLNASMGLVGLAVVAATTVMGFFGSASSRAKADSSEFAKSLEQDSGKIGDYTRKQALAALETQGLGKMAGNAGIDMGRMVDALLGVDGATEEVTAKFKAYAEATGLGRTGMLAFTGNLTELQQKLAEGREEYGRTEQAQQAATDATDAGTKAAEDQEEAIDGLSKALDELRGQFLDAQAAQSELEASVDDLTDSYKENGRTLDLGTEKGRANDEALRSLVGSAYDLSEATLRQTGSQAEANAVLLTQRQRLYDVLVQMGYTRAEAGRLTDEYFRIPDSVGTEITATAWNARGVISGVRADLNSLPSSKTITVTLNKVINEIGGQIGSLFSADGNIVRYYADGAHVAQIAPAGTTRVWAEPETGGEAYIPLAQSKRQRSTEILSEVAKNFGYQLMPASGRSFADGGAMGGSGPGAGGPQVIQVELMLDRDGLLRVLRKEVGDRGGNVQLVIGKR